MPARSRLLVVTLVLMIVGFAFLGVVGCGGGGGGGGGGTVTVGGPTGPVLLSGAMAEIRGAVLDGGRPAANVAVYLVDPARAFAAGLPRVETPLVSRRASVVYDANYGDFRAMTDASGQYVFPAVPTEIDYTLVAVRDATRQSVRTGVRAGRAAVIDVVLTPTGTIGGVARVGGTVGTSGHAGIVAFLEGTSHVALTGTDGRFTLSSVPVGSYTLRVQYNGYTPQVVPVTVAPAQTASPGAILTLAPATPSVVQGGVTGTVTRSPRLPGDSDDAGILVHLGNTTLVTCSAANGAWQFTGVQPGTYQLVFPSESYGVANTPAASLTVAIQAGVTTVVPAVTLQPRAQPVLLGDYVGHLTKVPAVAGDTDGSGVFVQLLGPAGSFLMGSDVTGRFEFRRIPQGVYTLSISDYRYRLTAGPTVVTIGATPAPVVPEYTVAPKVQAELLAEYAGVVKKTPAVAGDGDDSGVLVQLSGAGVALTTVSGPTGRFEFRGVPSGTYALAFNDPRYQLPAGVVAVAVTATNVTAIADAQLPVHTVVPRVTVVPVGNYGGQVVKQSMIDGDVDHGGVLVQMAGAGVQWLAGTDASGRFDFVGLPQGAYQLSIPDRRYRLPGGVVAVTVATAAVVPAPVFTVVPVVMPASPTGVIAVPGAFAGQITKTPRRLDESDESGVTVQLLNASASFLGSSNGTGRFDFVGLPQGQYWLSFPDDRYYWPIGSVAVTVATTPAGVLAVYALSAFSTGAPASAPAPATATVVPLGAYAGLVVKDPRLPGEVDDAGVSVQLMNASASYAGTTRSDGRFDFAGIPQGQYWLSFPDRDYQWPAGSVAVMVATFPPGTLSSYTVFPPGLVPTGFYAGMVTKTPLVVGETDHAGVIVQMANASYTFTSSTNASGRFDFRQIPLGTYSVVFPPARYMYWSGTTAVTVLATLPAVLPTFAVTPVDATGQDVTPPTVLTLTPAHGAVNIASKTLRIVFSENVFASTTATIAIECGPPVNGILESMSCSGPQVRVHGAVVEIEVLAPFGNTCFYQANVPAGAFVDRAGNPCPALGIGNWQFSDTTAPTITFGSPTVTLATSGPVVFPVHIAGAGTVNTTPGDVSLTVAGTVNATATVAITSGGATTPWLITVTNVVGDGTLSVSGLVPATVVDLAGNTGVFTQAPWELPFVLIDNTPPQAPQVTCTPLFGFGSSPSWTWTSFGEGGSGLFRYRFGNPDLATGATQTTSVAYTGMIPQWPPPMPPATFTLYVQERDNAGNWSPSGIATYAHATRLSVSTLAGPATGSADGIGGSAQFASPSMIAVGPNGMIYVADAYNDAIRMISPNGDVVTLAGQSGSPGSTDGLRSAARFNKPRGVCVDSGGNIFVSEEGNHTIRKITPSGNVTTVAGQAGVPGGADNIGTLATFNGPGGMCMDRQGVIYVTESIGHRIRRIAPPNYSVTTVAGSVAGILGSTDGLGTAARFSAPTGIAIDVAGILYVADGGNNMIRRIGLDGNVTTIAGVTGVPGFVDGVPMLAMARFNAPCGIAVSGDGSSLFVADTGNHAIRLIRPMQDCITLAGPMPAARGVTDGIGNAAGFNLPCGIVFDQEGRLIISDIDGQAIRVGVPVP